MTVTCPTCGQPSVRRGSQARPGRYQCVNRGCPVNYFSNRGEGHNHKRPNILSIDIETLPPKFYSWSPAVDYLSRPMLIQDWSLLSYSAKWIGDDKIISSVLTPEEVATRDDKRLAEEIWMLLDNSHVAVTHNGRRFDIKKINTRFWKHRLHKPSHYKVIDTLASAKQVFGLTYNTMDFIAEFKERDQKLHTSMSLWIRADHGDPAALREMLEYNDQDVITQEQIYLEMREWIPNHPNLTLYNKRDENACPVCLHKGHTRTNTYHYTNKKKYPEFRCKGCGTTWHSSKAVK